jgi:hypothetical protein
MSVAYRNGFPAMALIAAMASSVCAWPFVAPAAADETYKPIANVDVGAWPVGWSTQAYVYSGTKTTSTTDQNTSVHVDMTGGVGVLQYNFPWLSLAVIGNVGHSHIMYLQVLQDTYESSGAVGVRGTASLGPLLVTLGGSGAHDAFQTTLQSGSDNWDAREREMHGSVSSRLHFGGPVWLAPLVGFRYLDLNQDAHLLGTAIIPRETDPSKMLYGGMKVEFALRDERNNVLEPWVLGGVTHEFVAHAPLGPSVFIADQVAGNEYTLFPQGTAGVPIVFPDRTTGVLGLGVKLDFAQVVILNGAFYREFNSDYAGYTGKFGATVRW